MKRIALIHNPMAARTRPDRLHAVTERLQSAGSVVDVVATEGEGHATELAAAAVARGVELIAVYGGDGTVMQAVAGMQGSSAILGLIPGGTGNLLAGNLRIPRRPLKAAAVIAEGRRRTIDVGRLTTAEGSRYFAVGCGAGYDADMMAETTAAAKRRWGVGAYVAHAVRTAYRIAPSRFVVTVDGSRSEIDASSVIVSNCGEIIPPVLSLGREIRMDDGALDVVILNARGIIGTALTTLQLLRRRPNFRVRRLRGRRVVVEADEPRAVQADGDVCGTTPIEAEVVPDGITVVVPDGITVVAPDGNTVVAPAPPGASDGSSGMHGRQRAAPRGE